MKREELKLYLERIGLHEAPAADADGLRTVQQAHLATVPFENLDITDGRVPLQLSEEALFEKIVTHRRGGICYELNLLLAAALRALGYQVQIKGARHPKYGNDMDHLFLLATPPRADDDQKPWIVDVGFAANFAMPLRLIDGEWQNDGRDRYQLVQAPEVGFGYRRLWRAPGLSGDAELVEMFTFGPQTYEPTDCRERCDWFSTAPESRFTQGPLVTIDGPDGRRTLSARHYIETRGGVRHERDVESPEQFDRYLRQILGRTDT